MRIFPRNATPTVAALVLGILAALCWYWGITLRVHYAEWVNDPMLPEVAAEEAEQDEDAGGPQPALEGVNVVGEESDAASRAARGAVGSAARTPVSLPSAEGEAADADPYAAPERQLTFREAMEAAGVPSLIDVATVWLGLAGLVAAAGLCVAPVPKPWALRVVRLGCAAGYLTYGFLFLSVWLVVGEIASLGYPLLGYPEDELAVAAFFQRVYLLGWPTVGVLFIAWLHALSWRRSTIVAYDPEKWPEEESLRGKLQIGLVEGGGEHTAYEMLDRREAGDRVLENLRSHGEDPRYRRSLYASVFSHFAVIVGPILLAWLMSIIGCMEPYRIPKGEPSTVAVMVQQVQPKEKPKKKYVLNPQSAIVFNVPDLDDSDIEREVEQASQVTYTANPGRVHQRGQPGQGKKQGWPDGSEDAKFRFVLLNHGGERWDDGLNQGRSFHNFLNWFKREQGFRTANAPEAIRVWDIRKFPRGYRPPFLYMTGDRNIRLSGREIEQLREYLVEGGMLFVDCGYPPFDQSFKRFARQLFPSSPLRTIADDDPIFQYPYPFPNGAPPLWHHGGFDAKGIKVNNRWVVFYHPGDINDAWKDGHSGIGPSKAKRAFQMGVNIVYYSFTNYLKETRKHRK